MLSRGYLTGLTRAPGEPQPGPELAPARRKWVHLDVHAPAPHSRGRHGLQLRFREGACAGIGFNVGPRQVALLRKHLRDGRFACGRAFR
jgi:hypothetical protein